MVSFASLAAMAVGATDSARLAYSRMFAAAGPGMLGDKGLLALGIGGLICYAAFPPVARFLERCLFSIGAFFSPLHRVLRDMAARANNKWARVHYQKRQKLYAKNIQPGRR